MKKKMVQKKITDTSYRHNVFISMELNSRFNEFCKKKGLKTKQVWPISLEKYLTENGF